MKIVVISGAGSKVGKTSVLRALKQLLPNSASIKLGRAEEASADKDEMLLPSGSTLCEIKSAIGGEFSYLLVEGNSILKKFSPDLAIFVDGEVKDKRADADLLKAKCDLVAGGKIDCRRAFALAAKLGIDLKTFGELLNHINVKILNCQLGCF